MSSSFHRGGAVRRRRRSAASLVLILGIMAAGCGKSLVKDGFTDVSGTVTLDGDPLPNAQVVFVTPQGESYGRTDKSGRYNLEYSRSIKGAAVGPATVKISTRPVFRDEDPSDLEVDPRTGEHVKPERVPARYNTKTELKIEVTERGGPYDFPLQSEGAGD